MQSTLPTSRKLIVASAVLALVIVISAILLATRRKKPPADRETSVALMVMRSDLQGLLLAEATTHRLRGRFLNDPEAAGHLSSPGVNPPAITIVDTGFTATVTYKSIPGLRCAVGVFARNPLDRFAKSGEIVCD